ncbi:helix-turn-helix domain-containing protein [Eubacteriales bacterium OttesenSCG-928-N14]|nr:helix-turn-helix domain-containing protein [Eubacteriales bacterium OttesenSCG-928-N14]
MDFAEKMSGLMVIAGLTNSKLARRLRVDPSLISRWRNGSRSPVSNSDTMVAISSSIAANITTGYHRSLLSGLMGNEAVEQMGQEQIAEAIFRWLSADASRLARFDIVPQEDAEQNSIADISNNSFAGPQGRKMVIRRLFDLLDPNVANESILFYSSDPANWIKTDIEYRNSAIQNRPDLFANIGDVKLLLHSSATAEEIEYLLEFVIPFLESGRVHISQIPRHRKALFNNTILIIDKTAAAASHGFDGSENFMTNIYTNPAFVKKLSDDFTAVFAQCRPIHTIEQDVVLLDLIAECHRLMQHAHTLYYLGNALPPVLIPLQQLYACIKNTQGYLMGAEQDHASIMQYRSMQQQYLGQHQMVVRIPLYLPSEVDGGAASICCLPRMQQNKLLIDAAKYLDILQHTLALMQEHPNLQLQIIDELEHEHSVIFMPDHQVMVIRNHEPLLLYQSDFPNLLDAFSSFICRRFGTLSEAANQREASMNKLREYIGIFQKYLR